MEWWSMDVNPAVEKLWGRQYSCHQLSICDNPVVIMGQFKALKPDYVIPFKLDKGQPRVPI